MYQFFVEPDQIDVAGKSVIIRGTDVNHIKNVLRMRPGEEVAVSNGIDGKEYRCGILALEEDYWINVGKMALFLIIALLLGLALEPPFRKLNHRIEKSKEKTGLMI